MSNGSVWPTDRCYPPGLRGPGIDGNEEVLCGVIVSLMHFVDILFFRWRQLSKIWNWWLIRVQGRSNWWWNTRISVCFSCQRLLYWLDKNSSLLGRTSVPIRSREFATLPFRQITQRFSSVTAHSMRDPFLALVTQSKSEVRFIGSLHKRCYIVPLTNKR